VSCEVAAITKKASRFKSRKQRRNQIEQFRNKAKSQRKQHTKGREIKARDKGFRLYYYALAIIVL